MTTTLMAPERISRRSAVTGLLSAIPEDADVDVLRLVVSDDPTTTSSFFDELVRQVLVEGRARQLVIETRDEFLIEFATAAATTHGVSDRLSFG